MRRELALDEITVRKGHGFRCALTLGDGETSDCKPTAKRIDARRVQIYMATTQHRGDAIKLDLPNAEVARLVKELIDALVPTRE